ncbi:MAG: flagellar hook-associated protein FlgK [Candidatus Fibromonas sp.]|jgi:flagellar hook-associated protein 1 FlgK|nr:flagellar hook-associated protein FlgK [Candidatus Fibromonas sp.]
MSLFESLNMATRGLAAAQLGINVSGQNALNANTPGYSRKRIEQSSEWRRDGSFGQMGFGVEVYAINRVRDQFVDRLVNQELTRYGYFSIKDASYSRIESIFGEPSDGDHALNGLLNKFWNSWAELANDPSKAGPRETLRSTAQSLVTQFHYLSTQLRSYKDTINDEIEARVKRINEITSTIHRCNVVITGTEGGLHHNANDTRDQRDQLLEELAQLVDVDYYEDEDGALVISSNGRLLVSNARNHELSMRREEMTGDDGYQYSRVEVFFAGTGNEFKPKQGELRALMDVRDVDIPKYEQYINDIAKTLITEVNKIHQNGYTLDGLTFIDFFNSDPDKLNAANIDLSQSVKNNINNIAAGIGGEKKSAELGSISKIGDPPPPDAITINQLFPPGDPIGDSSSSYDLVNDTGTPDSPHYRFIYKNSLEISYMDNDGVLQIMQEGKDYDIDYNTAQITFKYSATGPFAPDGPGYNATNDAKLQIIIKFDYHENGYGGPGDGDNARLISQLQDKALMQSDSFGKSTQTINQFYAGALGRLGTERNEAEEGLGTRTYALEQLKIRQKEIMEVDINEEMANMMLYEHVYQASARFFTTVNSMFDTLLNM